MTNRNKIAAALAGIVAAASGGVISPSTQKERTINDFGRGTRTEQRATTERVFNAPKDAPQTKEPSKR